MVNGIFLYESSKLSGNNIEINEERGPEDD